jgi:hypothetical protein
MYSFIFHLGGKKDKDKLKLDVHQLGLLEDGLQVSLDSFFTAKLVLADASVDLQRMNPTHTEEKYHL